ncbi:MAG: hypothetical protein ACR2KQ_12275 [Actinomycetota bacterium]
MTEEYRYKVPDVARHFPRPDGKGKPGNAIRSWCRRGLVTGFYQHSKNAEYRLSARGVREAWMLWAGHKALDPQAHMPKEIRQIIEEATQALATLAHEEAERPIVRIEVPPGVAVEVIYRAA